jgi:chorismate mutase
MTDPMKQIEEIYDRIDVLDLEIDQRVKERRKLMERLREFERNG